MVDNRRELIASVEDQHARTMNQFTATILSFSEAIVRSHIAVRRSHELLRATEAAAQSGVRRNLRP